MQPLYWAFHKFSSRCSQEVSTFGVRLLELPGEFPETSQKVPNGNLEGNSGLETSEPQREGFHGACGLLFCAAKRIYSEHTGWAG
jgi:hypothetical protein